MPGRETSGVVSLTAGRNSQPTPDHPNAWRAEQDPHKLYQINKYLNIGNIVENEVNELTRWKQVDMKGNRKCK